MPCPSSDSSKTLKLLAEKADQYVQLETEEKLTWCTGCGNFGIQNALKRALVLEDYGTQDFIQCFDIGCNGNGSDKIHAYTLHGLHGRVISAAAGASLANTDMKVIASAGDGATVSEGVNHFIHAIRNNYDILFILHNNENYGLTTGQPSATTRKDQVMNAAPDGVYLEPLNVLQMALSLNPSFVARTFSGEVEHMTEMFRAGLKHKGFAIVEVMQVCSTYNKATSNSWFWERIKWIEDYKHYNRHDIWQAREIVTDLDKEIAMGVLYENPDSPALLDQIPSRKGVTTPAVHEVKHYDISSLLTSFS